MLMPLGLLSQGGGAGAGTFELISTQVLAATATSVSFSSIPATYTHLQLRVTGRTSTSSADVLQARFNSDSAANYAWHQLYGTGAAMASANATSQSQMYFSLLADSTSATSAFSAGIIDILDYANTNKYKTARSLAGLHGSSTLIGLRSSLWQSTAAINAISLFPAGGGNLQIGSRFSLYGIKGA